MQLKWFVYCSYAVGLVYYYTRHYATEANRLPQHFGQNFDQREIGNISVASKCEWRSNSRLNLEDKDPRSRKTAFKERDGLYGGLLDRWGRTLTDSVSLSEWAMLSCDWCKNKRTRKERHLGLGLSSLHKENRRFKKPQASTTLRMMVAASSEWWWQPCEVVQSAEFSKTHHCFPRCRAWRTPPLPCDELPIFSFLFDLQIFI